MNIDLKLINKEFANFYAWLKKDGLKAVKSERLHKKVIYTNLINGHQISLDNFKDYLKSIKTNNSEDYISKLITIKNGKKYEIIDLKNENNKYQLKLMDISNNTVVMWSKWLDESTLNSLVKLKNNGV